MPKPVKKRLLCNHKMGDGSKTICIDHYATDFLKPQEPVKKCLLCNHKMGDGSKTICIDHYATDFLKLQEPCKVLRCRCCNLRWLDPQLTDDEYHELYSQHYYEGNLGFNNQSYEDFTEGRQALFARRLQEIRQHLGEKYLHPKVVDFGAGTGDFVYIASQMGFEAYGYEISSYARQKAANKYGIDLWGGDKYRLPIEPRSVDIVHLGHVLERLASPHEYIELFYKWLRPKGLLVIEVPNQFVRLLDLINYYRRGGLGKYGILSVQRPYFYTRKSLAILLRQHFFNPERITTYYPYIQLDTPKRIKALIKKSIFFIGGLIGRGFTIMVFARKEESK